MRRTFPLRLIPSRLLGDLNMSMVALIPFRTVTFIEMKLTRARVFPQTSPGVAFTLKVSLARAPFSSWVSSEARILPTLPMSRAP